ncbi:MAG: hypothetical protein Q7V88_10650 [Actinomycetota bacterium]|nr:hypothetical protein [Actinomycetota bacterium]
MNTLHAHLHAHRHARRPAVRHSSATRTPTGFDWAAQIRLAVVLSLAAAIAAIALADRIAEPVLIVGIIVIASAVAWSRIEPVGHSATPARVHLRRR